MKTENGKYMMEMTDNGMASIPAAERPRAEIFCDLVGGLMEEVDAHGYLNYYDEETRQLSVTVYLPGTTVSKEGVFRECVNYADQVSFRELDEEESRFCEFMNVGKGIFLAISFILQLQS